jgi:hypothetical protein
MAVKLESEPCFRAESAPADTVVGGGVEWEWEEMDHELIEERPGVTDSKNWGFYFQSSFCPPLCSRARRRRHKRAHDEAFIYTRAVCTMQHGILCTQREIVHRI